jgi:class 3 adenylate cyclase
MASAPHAALRRSPIVAGSGLADIAAQLESTRWAAEVCDSEWRLVYVTQGLRDVVGFDGDDESLGIGEHVCASRRHHGWEHTLSDDDKRRWALTNYPYVAYDTPGGLDALREMIDPDYHAILDEIEPRPAPRLWASHFHFRHGELPPTRVNYIGTRSYNSEGQCAGTLFLYGPSLPTTTLSLVARGDEEMLARMAGLIEPGRRKAAVLFADLQSSGDLSRHLPTAAYFKLIQAITTAIDQTVADMRGIVGKHAGDGVTAFFLAEEFGSSEAASRCAIEAARAINRAATDAADRVMAETGVLDAPHCAMNIGVHWGGTLYMGQIVTGGRLEVTAIGDEVNECARIQETARDGKILVSKPLIEHLSDEDARALRIDPNSVGYRTLDELPDVSEKAVRDAGSIPVTILE